MSTKRKTQTKERGKLTTNGVRLESHERATVDYFLDTGKDIELLPPSNTPGNKTPDFCMSGLVWENKSPVVPKAKSIEKLFHKAGKQSRNRIMDLRRLPNDTDARKTLEKCFNTSKRVRNMPVITRAGILIIYKK